MPPKPFDEKKSADLDKAHIAIDSNDPVRQKLGQIWKKKIEQSIWNDTDD